VQLGAKNFVEIINEIIETLTWKTLVSPPAPLSSFDTLTMTLTTNEQIIFIILFATFCFSGASLYRSSPPHYPSVPHPPHQSQPAIRHHQQAYMYGQVPQTPSNRFRGIMQNDETPDTDASPDMKLLPPPYQTPSARRSPSKGERGRSPTKSRSPSKKW
jgi:hypothetical protein